ncbi:unnamed protein product [Alternaria alternata]
MASEPIAIIGMSCRFPGGASEPARLWDVLSSGQSAWSEVPKDRFNMEAFHLKGDPHSSTTNTSGGHFLDSDVATFDCSFFEIKPSEARAMDPQQRLTLELAYEAFENAGLTVSQIWGSSTGVYIGQWSSDYSEIMARDPENQELYHTLGTGAAITSNRVSFFFNLRGPSFTVDTGCSASLVALHNAVQSLRSGESTMSLVGGVNVLLDPQRFTYQSKLKMFSPDGRSFSFDERANGYGRGEGCGCVVLKPLSLAIKDGNLIRAVIRNSALNQDGRTPQGISVPNGEAQEELIRRAYAEAGLVPAETDYVEAHGTGTAVGDPIEAKAIANVLARPREATQGPLIMGSVKGNIGSYERARLSVLMLENQALAPQVNYEKPNPKIPLHIWNLKIPTTFEKRTLRRISINSFGYGGTNAHVILDRADEHVHPNALNHSDCNSVPNGAHEANSANGVNGANGVRHTNVSSGMTYANRINGGNGIKETSGISGVDRTNGFDNSQHTSILSGSNHVNPKTKIDSDVATRSPRVFILSGTEEQACYRNARRLAEYISRTLADSLEDVEIFLDRLALTVNKRTIHDYSTAVVAYDEDDLLAELKVLEQMPVSVRAPFKGGARVGYVFGGQGAQYHNMGRDLINDWPIFRQSLYRANTYLRALGCQWDLFTELSHESHDMSRVDEPEYGQTLSTAIQLALVDTLAFLNLRPSTVVGHSSGEIAAAYAVDALTFEDALTVAYHRGRLTSKLISTGISGSMLAVGATPEVVQTFIDQIKTTDSSLVKVACYNSPTSVTLSGGNDGIDEIARLLQGADIFHRKLKTQGAAYHSQMMHSIKDEYLSAIAHIQPRQITGRMISSLWGKELPAGTLLDGEYWARNLISPVLFDAALKGLILGQKRVGPGVRAEIDIILEVGPHAQMQGAVKETLKALGFSTRIRYLPCLKRKAGAIETMMRALADLFALGTPVDFHLANAGFRAQLPHRLIDVPPYAFNREQRHWHDTRITREFSHRQFLPHELLGNLSSDVNHTEPRWRRFLRLKELPWLQQHIVQGQIVFPAAGYLAMALEAMRRFMVSRNGSKAAIGYTLSDCSFSKALVLKEGDTETEICLSLRPEVQSAKGSWPDWKEFRIFSTNSGKGWNEHCRGRIRVITDNSMLADRLYDNLKIKKKALASFSHHISPNRFYATARQVGIEWYAPFDNVVDLQGRTDCCVTTNKMPNVQGSAHPFGPQTYLVHPGLLDSTLFHGICASLLVEQEIRTPMVPVFIEQLTISTAFEVSEGTELRTYASAGDEASSWSAQIEMDGRLVSSVHGMKMAQLPGDVKAAMSRQLAHSPEWVLHYPSMTRQQIIAHCRNSLPARSSRLRNIAVSTNVRTHVQQALDQIKNDEVASGYRQLWYEWMQDFVATDPYSREEVLEAKKATTSDTSAAFEGVNRIGENLVDLLRGTADPLSFLTPDDLLGRMYSEERNARCYHQINMYCRALGLHNPSLRMLEVGGGTASATLPLLQAMSQNGQPLIGQYDFTDLSTAFFPAARELLAHCGHNVNYKAFDLAQPSDTQGLESASYDVVIACNVVHATPNIASSLNNIRRLIRPGGTLILMEITTPEPSYQLVFGSLPGWWSGAGEGRVKSPILSDAEWTRRLQDQGFESDPIVLSDYAKSQGGTMSVIFAKTPVEFKPNLSEISLHLASGLPGNYTGNLDNIARNLRQRPELNLRQINANGLENIKNVADTVLVVDSDICEALAGMDASLWQKLQSYALSCKALLFITRGAAMNTTAPDGALALGFARSLRLEQPGIRYITLDLDPSTPHGSDDERTSSLITQLLISETFDFSRSLPDVDYEFADRNGHLYVNRLFQNDKLEQSIARSTSRSKPEQTSFLNRSRPLKVELGIAGLLETFQWVDDREYGHILEPHQIRIECRAASINFRDVLIATGELGGSATMMNDCAGTVVEVGSRMSSRYVVGDRVCSYYAQSYNNYPIVDGHHAARIPDSVSFSLGASLPIVWATTYHSLVNVAKLKAGETILIHAAAGAVGQAAVILAQYLGAVVYATCGSKEKRDLLESIGVPQTHIFTSRSPAFGPALRAATANKGVDVILNSLAGELFRESLDCLASFGRFVEIGKRDFLDNSLMPTKFLLRNIIFACVDLVQMMAEDKQLVYRLLNDVVKLVASGRLKTQVTIQPYKLGEIEAAFRLISSGKHMGKVILTVDQDETVPALPEPCTLPMLQPDATYILAGGFGGLGIRLIWWLGARGARTIVVLSRSGQKSAAANACVAKMRSMGIKVIARSCDISSKAALEAVIRDIQVVDKPGPIRGVINAAMALEDALYDQMTHQQWKASLAPKVAGTWNLHEVLPRDIDFFVALSSVAGISGHAAQVNYTSACTFQDASMHYRRNQGQSGFAIDVGVVGDAGFVSETPTVLASMKRQGFSPISVVELLAALDYALTNSGSECQATIGLVPEAGVSISDWLEQRRIAHLVQDSEYSGGVRRSGGSGDSAEQVDQIRSANTAEEAVTAIGHAVLAELSKLTVTPVEGILPYRTLESYGVDSLVAVELRNWIVVILAADVSLLLIRESRSIEELIRLIAARSKLVPVKL